MLISGSLELTYGLLGAGTGVESAWEDTAGGRHHGSPGGAATEVRVAQDRFLRFETAISRAAAHWRATCAEVCHFLSYLSHCRDAECTNQPAEYLLRLQYSMAVVRLVNGVTDPGQKGRVAVSVAGLAAAAGVSLTFICAFPLPYMKHAKRVSILQH